MICLKKTQPLTVDSSAEQLARGGLEASQTTLVQRALSKLGWVGQLVIK